MRCDRKRLHGVHCTGFRLGWAHFTISTYDFYLFAYNHASLCVTLIFHMQSNISVSMSSVCECVCVCELRFHQYSRFTVSFSPLSPFICPHPPSLYLSAIQYFAHSPRHTDHVHYSAQIRSNTNRPNITLNLPFRMPENVSSFFPFAGQHRLPWLASNFPVTYHVPNDSVWLIMQLAKLATIGNSCCHWISQPRDGPQLDCSNTAHTRAHTTHASTLTLKIAVHSARKLILVAPVNTHLMKLFRFGKSVCASESVHLQFALVN